MADEKGWTALAWAAHAGNLALTALLVHQGADTSVHPCYAGKRLDLCEFLDAAVELPPGIQETEAGRERLLQLSSVRDFLASRMHA